MSTNKLVYVNSDLKDSESISNSDFYFHMQDASEYAHSHAVCLKKATIPKSFYTLPEDPKVYPVGNVTTHHAVGFQETGFPTVYYTALPGGSPTSGQWASQLQTMMNAAAVANGSGRTYTVVYNLERGKYQFQEAGGFDYDLTFVPTATANTFYTAVMTGFEYQSTNTSGASVGGYLESKNVADLTGTKNIFVEVSGALTVSPPILEPPQTRRQIIATIPVDVNAFSVIQWHNEDIVNSRRMCEAPARGRIRVRLLDDLGVPLDLQGLSIRLEFLFQQ